MAKVKAKTKLAVMKGHLVLFRERIEACRAVTGVWPTREKLGVVGILVNPFNGLSVIRKPGSRFPGGWVYDESTGKIHADDSDWHRSF